MVAPLPIPFFLLSLFVTPLEAAQDRSAPRQGTVRTTVRIQQHIIVRVPRVSLPRQPIAYPAPLPPISWTERRAAECVPVQTLAGASVTRSDSVDLLLAGGKRMRARFNADCPTIDFYAGLYVRPASDGQLCARRDSVRSRSGGECRIETFSALVPTR